VSFIRLETYESFACKCSIPRLVAQRTRASDFQPLFDTHCMKHVRTLPDEYLPTAFQPVNVNCSTRTRVVDTLFANTAHVELVLPRPRAEPFDVFDVTLWCGAGRWWKEAWCGVWLECGWCGFVLHRLWTSDELAVCGVRTNDDLREPEPLLKFCLNIIY